MSFSRTTYPISKTQMGFLVPVGRLQIHLRTWLACCRAPITRETTLKFGIKDYSWSRENVWLLKFALIFSGAGRAYTNGDDHPGKKSTNKTCELFHQHCVAEEWHLHPTFKLYLCVRREVMLSLKKSYRDNPIADTGGFSVSNQSCR